MRVQRSLLSPGSGGQPVQRFLAVSRYQFSGVQPGGCPQWSGLVLDKRQAPLVSVLEETKLLAPSRRSSSTLRPKSKSITTTRSS